VKTSKYFGSIAVLSVNVSRVKRVTIKGVEVSIKINE
jgi:hypothetical protein